MMTRDLAECERLEGYLDGIDPNELEPSGNRTASYRHGFANGRADLAGRARARADELRVAAEVAIAQDCGEMVFPLKAGG